GLLRGAEVLAVGIRALTRPEVLGQGGAVDGLVRVGREDRDGGVGRGLADRSRGGIGRHPTTDDHVVVPGFQIRHRRLLRRPGGPSTIFLPAHPGNGADPRGRGALPARRPAHPPHTAATPETTRRPVPPIPTAGGRYRRNEAARRADAWRAGPESGARAVPAAGAAGRSGHRPVLPFADRTCLDEPSSSAHSRRSPWGARSAAPSTPAPSARATAGSCGATSTCSRASWTRPSS